MRIDHVAFGWDGLEAVVDALAAVGLDTEYGGTHEDGTTHMALVGFEDGSYLELLAPTEGSPPTAAGFWPDALAARAGPCAWAIRTDDVVAAATRAVESGLPIEGPLRGGRERPDGSRIEWDQFFQGTEDRWCYPFVIADRTPREWRVSPTEGVAERDLWGVDTVVLGVDDVDDAAARFERRYRFPTPTALDTDAVEGVAATVPGRPVAFVTAAESRLEQVGERPVAYLLGTDDIGGVRTSLDLTPTVEWGERRLAWLDHDLLRGRVGVVE